MDTNHRIAIRFVQHVTPYQVGEMATFPMDQAQRHINSGAAVYANSEMPKDAENLRDIIQTRHVPGPTVTQHVPGPKEKQPCPHCKKLYADVTLHIKNRHK
jgi:hypothetical protein